MILNILNIIAILTTIYVIKLGTDYNKGSIEEFSIERLHPGEVNYLYKDINYLNRGILVTLLELMRRGKISIEEYTRESRNKTLEDFVTEYKFALLDTSDLKDHERAFLRNIFVDEEVVTTDELTQRAISGSEFLKSQGNWSKSIENELGKLKLYGKGSNRELANKIKVLGLAIAILGIYSLIQQNLFGLVSIGASLPIFLIGINMGMEKSSKGRSLLNHYAHIEELAKQGKIKDNLSEQQLLELLALTVTMKYFLPIYENSNKYETIDLVVNSINEYGGSVFDDAILRGFMGFTAKTRDDTLDTNRIDYRLFK